MTYRRWALGALLLCGLTCVVYLPVLEAGFIWDDDAYVTGNRLLRDLNGLFRIWFEPSASPQYYPLVFTTFWLEYQLWGLDPAGYHLVNVLFHAGAAALLWVLLEAFAVPGAWLVAAVFAVHPINVESVAWVAERKNVLSAFLVLLSALAFLSPCREGGRGWKGSGTSSGWPSAGRYFLSFALFLLALMSKTVVATAPVVLALLIWWRDSSVLRRHALSLIPFLAIGMVAGLGTAWLELSHVGAAGPEWELSIVERLLVASRSVLFYAWKLAWPADLLFSYPRWNVDATAWWQYVAPIAVLGALGGLWFLRKKLGRGPLVGVLSYIVTLAPASGILNVYPMRFSFVADHFQYLAGIGLIALGVGGAVLAANRTLGADRFGGRRATVMACIVILLALGSLARQRMDAFNDEETLWTSTLEGNPSSWLALNNLGLLRQKQDRLHEAVDLFESAIKIRPDEASFHNNLGMALMAQGALTEALECYMESLGLNSEAPVTLVNIGIATAMLGDAGGAISYYRHAIGVADSYAPAYYNLGYELAQMGQVQEALNAYRAALLADPEYVEAHNNLGTILVGLGEVDEATAHFCAAVKLRPDFALARENLAGAIRLQGPGRSAVVACP